MHRPKSFHPNRAWALGFSFIFAFPVAGWAQPILVNGGFEAGDLTGWTIGGNAGIAEALDSAAFTPAIAPTEGSFMGIVTNGPGQVDGTSQGDLDGDASTTDDNDRSGISQTFTLTAGQTPARLSFDLNWLTAEDGTVNDDLDDFFLIRLNGAPIRSGSVDGKTLSPFVGVPTDLTSVAVTGGTVSNGCAFGFGQSGFASFETVIVSPGTYTLEFLVSDQGASNFVGDSALLVDNVQVLPTSDVRVDLTAPDAANAGTDASYQVSIENLSGAVANDVVLTVDFPFDVPLLTSSEPCNLVSPTQWTCNIGALGAGELRTVNLSVRVAPDAVVGAGGSSFLLTTASVQSSSLDTDPANNTSGRQTLVTDRADLRVTKIRSPNTGVPAGTPFTFTFFVENLGPSYARPDIVLLDTIFSSTGSLVLDDFQLDPNLADSGPFVDPSPPGSQVHRFELNDPLPPPGEPTTNRWVIQATYIASDAQSVTETASVPATPGGTPDPVPSNNEVTDSLSVTQTADLKVTQFADASGPVNAGDIVTYTLIVDNLGPASASGVAMNAVIQSSGVFDLIDIISDRDASSLSLPPGGPTVPLTATPWPPTAPPPPFGVDPTTGVADVNQRIEIDVALTNPLDPLQANGPPNVGRWIVTLRLRARDAQSITSVADVLSGLLDLDLSNNHAEAQNSIAAAADLVLTKTFVPGPPLVAGDVVSWDITITNNGPSIARNVVVRDELPAGVSSVTAVVNSPAAGSCALGVPGDPNHLVCGLGDLPAAASVTIAIDGFIDAGFVEPILSNSATVTADSFDPNNANNQGTATELVGAEAPVVVLLDDLPDPVRAGENIGYAVFVGNVGPSVARDVQVFHELPLECETPTFEIVGAPGAQAVYDPLTQTIICRLGDLVVNQVVYILVNARVRSDTPDETVLTSFVDTLSLTSPFVGGDLADTLVITECDASIVKGASAATVPAGERLTYTLTLANSGLSDASGVRVYDVLPDGVRPLTNTASPSCTQPDNLLALRAILNGDEVVPPVTTLARGKATAALNKDTFEFIYALRVTEIDNIVSAHLRSGDVGVNGPVVADLFTGAPPPFSPTSALTGFVTLTAAQAADIEAAPGDFYIDIRTADFAAGEIRAQLQSAAATPISCEVGTLPAGASQTISILAQLNPDIAPESLLENVGLITTGGDIRVSNNVSAVTTLSDAVADLSVIKFSKPETTVPAGTSFTYTILVRNNGPSFAHGVRIRDQAFSSGAFTILAVTDDPTRNDSLITLAGGTIELRLNAPLEPVGYGAGTGTWTIQVRVSAAQAQDINNLVRVFTTTNTDFPVASTDPDLSNNEAIDFISVQDQADLSLTMVVDKAEVDPGGVITYTLAVTNNGPSTAANVVVRDVMPAGVTFQNLGSTLGGCAIGSPGEAIAPAVCQLGAMASGQSALIELKVIAPATGQSGPLINFGSVLSDKVDPNNANNIASAVTQYIAPAPSPSPQPVPPSGCGAGACGAGTAGVAPLLGLLGLGWTRGRRRTRIRNLR